MSGPQATWRARPRHADAVAVAALCRASGVFSEQEALLAAELVDERLARGAASGYSFILADNGASLAGYACYGPVPCTRHSWDLYWIVVDPAWQGGGLGRALLARVEHEAALAGGRRVYVETSSRSDYEPARRFYTRHGYAREAFLPDYYAPGDGKLILSKAVAA